MQQLHLAGQTRKQNVLEFMDTMKTRFLALEQIQSSHLTPAKIQRKMSVQYGPKEGNGEGLVRSLTQSRIMIVCGCGSNVFEDLHASAS